MEENNIGTGKASIGAAGLDVLGDIEYFFLEVLEVVAYVASKTGIFYDYTEPFDALPCLTSDDLVINVSP
ncbi:hypothetical protein DSUL_20408 [Desulfovibrionales bacterium]